MKKTINTDGARMTESGNVLFLILIAVALFAALSYAVTQSTRSGGGDAGRETNKISSAQLTQYPASVRTSIVRMVIGGQDVNTLEFNAPADFTNCTEEPPSSGNYPRCVFHPSGGGATYVEAPGSLMASGSPGGWIFNGANEIKNIGTSVVSGNTSSTATADLIAFLPGITKGVCESINDELGLPPPDLGNTDQDGIVFTSASSMINSNGNTDTSMTGTGGVIGSAEADFAGQPFGCFTTGGQYVYYHVLVER